jgi:hypothetical protein
MPHNLTDAKTLELVMYYVHATGKVCLFIEVSAFFTHFILYMR